MSYVHIDLSEESVLDKDVLGRRFGCGEGSFLPAHSRLVLESEKEIML
jgi:hypothetical protein